MTLNDSRHVGRQVAVVGAGIGGLTAAALLARSGCRVLLFERASQVGGKMRTIDVLGSDGQPHAFDAGPTVLTMRAVFDDLFASCGESLEDYVSLQGQEDIARHFFSDGEVLDLYTSPKHEAKRVIQKGGEIERNVEAIRAFSDTRNAQGYEKMCAHFQYILAEVYEPFMMSQRPTVGSLLKQQGLAGISAPWRMDVTRSLWDSLSSFYSDERLIRLFGRYATYCGSSPFEAPATLGIISEVERLGVWTVDGGMFQLAAAVKSLCEKLGVEIHVDTPIGEFVKTRNQVSGVITGCGKHYSVDAVICNADIGAVGRGDFGTGVKRAGDHSYTRSLSAVIHLIVGSFSRVKMELKGENTNDLLFHNVFFSGASYADEFESIFKKHELPDQPTVYVCAQDRRFSKHRLEVSPQIAAQPHERLYCLTNAPACGDRVSDSEIGAIVSSNMRSVLGSCGYAIDSDAETMIGPENFETRFPGTKGCLYGPVSHGWRSALDRQPAVSNIKKLYFVGGSVHPGAGVPMAAISGRLAAERFLADAS